MAIERALPTIHSVIRAFLGLLGWYGVALLLLGAAARWDQPQFGMLKSGVHPTGSPPSPGVRRQPAPIRTAPAPTVQPKPHGKPDLCIRRNVVGLPKFRGEGRHRYVDGLSVPGIKARGVSVALPLDYGREQRLYPVIYVHDGQYMHEGELAVVEAVDLLHARGLIDPHIVVGIERTEDRSRELKPVFMRRSGPHLQGYARLLVEVVKPLVDAHFRSDCRREHTTLVGYSLGGLANFYLMMWYPKLFGRVAAMSPSFWWHQRQVLADLEAYQGELPDRVWVDAGTREGRAGDVVPYFIDDIRRARDLLLGRGLSLGDRLGYLEDPGAIHAGWAGGRRMPSALAFLLAEARPKVERPAHLGVYLFRNRMKASERTGVSVTAYYEDPFMLTLPNLRVDLSSQNPATVGVGPDGLVDANAAGESLVVAKGFGRIGSDSAYILGRVF